MASRGKGEPKVEGIGHIDAIDQVEIDPDRPHDIEANESNEIDEPTDEFESNESDKLAAEGADGIDASESHDDVRDKPHKYFRHLLAPMLKFDAVAIVS